MEINLERFVSESSSFITLWRIFFFWKEDVKCIFKEDLKNVEF